jgi:hypothetical protein
MTRIVFLLIYVTVSLAFSLAGEAGKITFNTKKHDFGVISDKGGSVSFDFVLTNNSKEPLLINNVKASCGCTTLSWTKTPVEPDKSGTITVSYNPSGQHGTFLKSITVYTNQEPSITLQITGGVTNDPAPEKDEKTYPVAFGSYLLKSKDLNFGQLNPSDSKTIRLEAFNNSDKPVTQKITHPQYFTVNYSPVVEPKKASVIEVTFLVANYKKYGYANGNLVFYINNRKQIFPYSALILDDFSNWIPGKITYAGKINTNTEKINFGNLRAGTSRTLKLSNSGKSVLNIRNIQSSSPWITISGTTFDINPGEIVETKVHINKNKIKSSFNSTLSIVSNDPKKPLFEVEIIANP